MIMVYHTIYSTLTASDSYGLLVNLHFHDFLPADKAAMCYTAISAFLIVAVAASSSALHESKMSLLTVALTAALMWIGWIHTSDDTRYWGVLIFLLVLSIIMIMNDRNAELYGRGGPGQKIITAAVMIALFTGSFGFITTGGILPADTPISGTTQNQICNQYTCDSAGNVDLGASVSTISNTGGIDVISAATGFVTLAVSALLMMINILSCVVAFSVVMTAAFPWMAASPQLSAFFSILNIGFIIMYLLAIWQWFFKPPVGTGDV